MKRPKPEMLELHSHLTLGLVDGCGGCRTTIGDFAFISMQGRPAPWPRDPKLTGV